MTESYLIYPHQLFEEVKFKPLCKTVILVEDPLFFKQYNFHKKKLIFHRATMKAYCNLLKSNGFKVIYIESFEISATEEIAEILKKNHIRTVHVFDVVDDWLEKKVYSSLKKFHINIIEHDSPGFYLSRKDLEKDLGKRTSFLMASFYTKQRKRFNILLDNGKPVGGKWSYDTENRKKLPKNFKLPKPPHVNQSTFVKEAVVYIDKYFANNYGSSQNFVYPVTHEAAALSLNEFLDNKLNLFGPYQDSISQVTSQLFHSVLSPLINSGLLTPVQVVDKTLEWAKKNGTPLNCLEGFIRQIIGWREFVRGVYSKIGREERTKNFFGFTRKLPKSFWNGTTGIAPVDNIILKVLETGYANHIERLMVIANFMLLSEIDPDDVYLWFMELFIDSYDWVMVPNVYGMGIYADGGMITTKPYISGANYILKMSDFEKGEWVEIWNSLYWNFIDNQKTLFRKNPRCQMAILMLEKMDPVTLVLHKKRAADFLKNLD
jgi:deoxyribodipyrimidine photolyase-related protein